MERKRVRILFALLIGVTCGGALYADQIEPIPDRELVAMQDLVGEIGMRPFDRRIAAIDFVAPALHGEAVSLEEYRGSLVFLNFWATWCPPCREEMPSMQRLSEELDDAPFEIIAVNVREPRETVDRFIEAEGYTYPIALDGSGRVSASYAVRGIPTTYMIAPDGSVLGMLVGTREWDTPEVVAAFRAIAERQVSVR